MPEKDSAKSLEKENSAVASLTENKKENKLSKRATQFTLQKTDSTRDNRVAELQDNSSREYLQKSMQAEAPKREEDVSDKKNILKGKVQDSHGNAIGFATLKDKSRQTTTISDSAGRFKLSARDSSVTATVAAVGYKSKEIKLSNKNDEVIVLQTDSRDLAEVVVTGVGMQKQKRESNIERNLEGKVAGVSVNTSISEPVAGREKFNEYIHQNINIPKDASGVIYKGKVILSFEVNKKGIPRKIKTDQSLCDECDKEAIRLLEKGPKWKYIKNIRQTVTIEF